MKVSALRTGAFTASIQLGGSTALVNNRFDGRGRYEGSFVLATGRLFRLILNLGSPAGMLTGTVTDPATGTQLPFVTSRANPKPLEALVGAYTAQFPLVQSGPALPGGTGFCRLSVTATGGVMLVTASLSPAPASSISTTPSRSTSSPPAADRSSSSSHIRATANGCAHPP